MKRILITLAITVTLLAVVATNGFALFLRNNACTADKYREVTVPILTEWRQAETIAKLSPLDELPSRIATMRDIHRRFVDVDYPSCNYQVHDEMSDSLEQSVAGYESKLAGDDPSVTNAYFEQANQHLNNAATMLSEID